MENNDFIGEIESLVVQKEEKKPATRLTPAQQREAKTDLIIQGIQNGSLQEVKDAHALYPKANLSQNVQRLMTAICTDFSAEIADFLKNELEVKYQVARIPRDAISPEGVKYFLDLDISPPQTFSQQSYDHYLSYNPHYAEQYKKMCTCAYSEEWRSFYFHTLVQFKAEENSRAKTRRKLILEVFEQKYPTILSDILSDPNRASDFVMKGFEHPQALLSMLEKSGVNWDDVFAYWKEAPKFQYVTPKCFLGMMKVFQAQNILDKWQEYIQSFSEDKKAYDAIQDEFFSDTDYKSSKLYDWLKTAKIKGYGYGSNANSALQHIERSIKGTADHQKYMANTYPQKGPYNKTENDFFKDVVTGMVSNIENIQTLFNPNLLKKDHLYSPYERMFASNMEMCKTLLQTSYGQKIFRGIYNDQSHGLRQSILSEFLSNADIQIFRGALKAIPEMMEYRDKDGNNIFHVYVSQRKDTAKTVAESLLRGSKELFAMENDAGKTVLDLMIDNGMDSGAQAYIEKMLMKKSLNDDEEAGAKLRSRTKFSAPKRRM